MSFLGDLTAYTAPSWMPSSDEILTPTHKFKLAHTPTPIQRVSLPGLPESHSQILVKRDDMTGGIELSGNKVRKLEFLLADAKQKGCDCVLTAGGTQSNHCRATVAAARTVGLPTTLLIRDDFAGDGGNFFLDTILGADIRFLERSYYLGKGGWPYFFESTLKELRDVKKQNPYFIPVGGTCPLGNWGYIECAREVFDLQLSSIIEAESSKLLTNIVTATGSGSTLTGLGLGAYYFHHHQNKNGRKMIQVTGYGVCDTPEYFYEVANTLTDGMFATHSPSSTSENTKHHPGDSHQWLDCRDARGLGYSKASTEELQFLNRVARETGIVFDRSYTNKAVFQMTKDLASGSLKPEGQLMFIHTGGGPSAFDRHQKILNCEGWKDEDETGK